MNIRIFSITAFFAAMTLVISACSNDEMSSGSPGTDARQETAVEHAKKHIETQNVCPKHPNIIKDEPG